MQEEKKTWINVTFKKRKQFDFIRHLNLLSLTTGAVLMGWASFKRKTNVLGASTWALGTEPQPPALSELFISLAEFGDHKTLKTVRLCALFSPVCSHVTLVNYSRKEPVPRGPRCSEQIMHRAERCQSVGELMRAQIKQELTQSDSSNLTRADLFG